MDNKIKVFIVDDHDMFRDGVKLLLSSGQDAEVVAEACNGKDFLEKVEKINPDVVLMDIAMPEIDGIEASKRVKDILPNIKILALTMFGDEKYYYQMIQAGVKGFVLKSSGIGELLKAIHEVNEGRSYFSNELLVKLIASVGRQAENNETIKAEIQSISKREVEVLKLISQGFTNEEIAKKLHVSATTIRTHRANLMSKTNCNNTASLVMYAIKNKIIGLS
jgi:DNA-binding NarL/FixJ family response regulator